MSASDEIGNCAVCDTEWDTDELDECPECGCEHVWSMEAAFREAGFIERPGEYWLGPSERWSDRAERNLMEWGQQDVDTLLLAMQEELGELTQAYLEARNEDGDEARIQKELRDLAALCFQVEWRLTSRSVDADNDRIGGGPEE